jgi:hypothetical protein
LAIFAAIRRASSRMMKFTVTQVTC